MHINHGYLLIYQVLSRYIEEKNGNKYLVFGSTDETKELLKNTQTFGMELKMKSKQKKWW